MVDPLSKSILGSEYNDRGLVVVIPFYKGIELVERQQLHFEVLVEELGCMAATFVLVNDFPSDPTLQRSLESLQETIESRGIRCRLVVNSQNLGFVKSANIGLQIALDQGSDVLLLNSDAFPDAGCISELCEVLHKDDLIGFVGPRSNRATLASIPWWSEFTNIDVDLSRSLFQALQRWLPRVQIVPTIPGFCLLISISVLEAVGLLDESYSPGYNEENDLICRANRVGFRSVLANYAFAVHMESVSFLSSKDHLEAKNSVLLLSRFPEYARAVSGYYEGPSRIFERLVTELERAKMFGWRLLIDLSMLGKFYNGTFTLALRLTEMLVNEFGKEVDIGIVANRDVMAFHNSLGLLNLVEFYGNFDEIKDTYTVVFRPSQPFSWSTHTQLNKLAPVVSYLMLDTIALDCSYLAVNQPELESVLSFAAEHSDMLAFISESSMQTFETRFGANDKQLRVVSMPSTDLAEYDRRGRKGKVKRISAASKVFRVLVIGNHYEHKMVNKVSNFVAREVPNVRVYALGYTDGPHFGVVGFGAGELKEEEVDALFRKADLVVFPSNSEGFGFPIVETLACGIPLVLRNRAVNKEVIAHIDNRDSPVFFFGSYNELRLAVSSAISGDFDEGWLFGNSNSSSIKLDWKASATKLMNAFEASIDRIDKGGGSLRSRNLILSGFEASEVRNTGEMANLRLRCMALEGEVADFRRSTSWSVTAPGRWASRTISKIWRLFD